MTRQYKKFVSIFLMVLMLFTSILSNAVITCAAEKPKDVKEIKTYKYNSRDINSLTPIFYAIEDIPDELLKSGNSEQITQYFYDKGVQLNCYNDLLGETSTKIPIISFRSNQWRCGLAIGQLLVTVGIPATKLAKIKKYISALGGVKKTVGLLIGATSVSEKLGGTLAALSELILTLTGISDNKEYCFG